MENTNGDKVFVDVNGDYEDGDQPQSTQYTTTSTTLYSVLHTLISSIFFPDPKISTGTFQRIKKSFKKNVPLIPEASRNTGRNVLIWTRRGNTPLRPMLVISVGTITLLTLTGLLVFMLFFIAATLNAIIISFLFSLAAAGGFLALFFACLTAIYIGALSVAVFVISTTTVIAGIAILITIGWVGFFWTVWLATKKSVGLAKHSLSVTGSAISAYSSTRHGSSHHYEQGKVSD